MNDGVDDELGSRRVCSRGALCVVIALSLVAIGAAVQRTAELWEERWVQDDAYISFRYARNLIEGHGLVFNEGHPVEGYTNFLWTMGAAAAIASGASDPIGTMHAVGVVCWVLTMLVLLVLAGALASRDRQLAAPLLLVPLTVHYSYGLWFVSGMETPLVSLLTVMLVALVALYDRRRAWVPTAASIVGVLLVMTRPDGVVVVVAVALVGLAVHWRALREGCRWRELVIGPVIPWLVVYLPYTIWRVVFYGSLLPNTYYAKVAYLPHYERGWGYLSAYLGLYELWPFLLLPLVGAVVARGPTTRRFLWCSIAASVAVSLYVVRLGGDFMEWRFVTPVSGVLYPAIVVAGGVVLAELARRLGKVRSTTGWQTATCAVGTVMACAGLTATTVIARGTAPDTMVVGQESIPLLARYCDPEQFDWPQVGRALDRVLPEHVTIATTAAGAIPYFCDRVCLDLHGLTDPVIAREPVDPLHRGRMGHEHWLTDLEVMRRRGVDVYLPWPDIKRFPAAVLTLPENGRHLVSVRVKPDRWADFLILNPSAMDVEAYAGRTDVRTFDSDRVVDRAAIVELREQLDGWRLVDRLDLENRASEEAHGFVEEHAPDAPYGHNYHTKSLAYFSDPPVVLSDDGRRIYHAARWSISGVHGGRPLRMVIRHDCTGPQSHYRVVVNGRELSTRVRFGWAPAQWREVATTIPPERLRDGTNTFELIRVAEGTSDAELYHIWFLQPESGSSAGL